MKSDGNFILETSNRHKYLVEKNKKMSQVVPNFIQSGIDVQKEFNGQTDLFEVATEIINRSGLTAEQSDTYLQEVNQKYDNLLFSLPSKLGECYFRLRINPQFDNLSTELQDEISAKLVGVVIGCSEQIQKETRGHASYLFPALNSINLLVPIVQSENTNEVVKRQAIAVIEKLKGQPDVNGETDSTYKKINAYIRKTLPMLSPDL